MQNASFQYNLYTPISKIMWSISVTEIFVSLSLSLSLSNARKYMYFCRGPTAPRSTGDSISSRCSSSAASLTHRRRDREMAWIHESFTGRRVTSIGVTFLASRQRALSRRQLSSLPDCATTPNVSRRSGRLCRSCTCVAAQRWMTRAFHAFVQTSQHHNSWNILSQVKYSAISTMIQRKISALYDVSTTKDFGRTFTNTQYTHVTRLLIQFLHLLRTYASFRDKQNFISSLAPQ